ncbi:MAG: hypothetical protein KBB70_00420 [Candidatus Pacebacteria bacterium]|nr:hypothetical protein [Candidatus Paceibacterota bacterium]
MKKFALYVSMFLLPGMAFARTTEDGESVLIKALDYVDMGTQLLSAIGILVFIFGIVKYVIANNEEQKANAQRLILYGVIGLFAIVAVWGLVNFIANTTGVGADSALDLPCPAGFDPC